MTHDPKYCELCNGNWNGMAIPANQILTLCYGHYRKWAGL